MEGFIQPLGGIGPGDEFGPLLDKIKETAEKLGLYMQDAVIATPDDQAAEALSNGQTIASVVKDGAPFAIMAAFAIGDVAWRKRTLDPEQDSIDDQTRLILPDPAEEIKRRLADGGPLFEDDDDE